MPSFPYPNFIGPSYQGRSLAPACDRTINLYPELVESGTGKNAYCLVGTPGLKCVWDTGLEQPIRGICTLGQKRILIAGRDTLYEVNVTTGALETIGGIQPDTEWDGLSAVTFAWNGNQYAIASGGQGYLLDGTTLTPTIKMDSVDYLDGYFVALQSGDRRIRISGLYDGTTWDELDYAEKESRRDYPIAILADHGELWIFGEQTTEVWYNSGNSDFPFERIPNGRLELGCGAPWSPAKLDNSVFWIGQDERGNRVVWRADGYTAKRVSTHAVEYHMNRMLPKAYAISDTIQVHHHAIEVGVVFAICWAYQEEGHSFYCMTFPEAPAQLKAIGHHEAAATSFVYDAATGLWHERAWWNPATGAFELPRQRCHAYIWDHHFVGDRANGKVYEQHLELYDDDGYRIRRERTGPHLSFGMRQTFYHSFQLDMEVGVGLGAIDSDIYGPDADGVNYEV